MATIMSAREESATAPATPAVAKQVLEALASLRLTVVLLAASTFLVFAGTLAQIDGGIWTIVHDYFRSLFVWIPLKIFAQFTQIFVGWPSDPASVRGAIPFPGGWTIGGLMLANLVAAHAIRFKLSWSRAGVLAVHSGLILLMLGEFVAGVAQVESRMTITHGETVNYIEDTRAVELVVIDASDATHDVEVTVPESLLKTPGRVLTDPQLPVDIQVVQFMPNAELQPLKKGLPDRDVVTSRQGIPFAFFQKEEVSGVDVGGHEDAVSVRVNLLKKGTDEVIASKLLSLWFSPNFTRRIPMYQFPPQEFAADGKTYRIELRGRRDYLPFSLRLDEFRFDRYPGTNIPKNYSSRVQLTDPRTGSQREVLIKMNEPLAYDGITYYQSGFTPDEKGTVLHATRNPGVWLPYISCTMISLGMLFHFGQKLFAFLMRSMARAS
jgi:hypothetical protein